MFYANIQNNKLVGASQCKVTADGLAQIEITEELFNNIEKCILVDGEVVIDPDYDTKKAKEEKKAEILAELEEIDAKSIRALRAEENDRLIALEQQAIALREELGAL